MDRSGFLPRWISLVKVSMSRLLNALCSCDRLPVSGYTFNKWAERYVRRQEKKKPLSLTTLETRCAMGSPTKSALGPWKVMTNGKLKPIQKENRFVPADRALPVCQPTLLSVDSAVGSSLSSHGKSRRKKANSPKSI